MPAPAFALLDALLRPLAMLPPGLPVVVAEPLAAPVAASALSALGFAVTAASPETASALPAGAYAWGVAVAHEAELPALAAALRPALAPGAWLSVAVETRATASVLVGWMETAGFVLAQAPETLPPEGMSPGGLHGIFRRVDAGVIG